MKTRFSVLIIGFVIVIPILFFSGMTESHSFVMPVQEEDRMLLGLRTVVYHVDDLDMAKNWYTNNQVKEKL